MRTHSVELFAFEELSPEAQKKAIEQCQNRLEQFDYTSDIQMAIEHVIVEKGMPTDELEFRFSYSQGDGVAWYGGIDLQALLKAEPKLFAFAHNIRKMIMTPGLGDVEIVISRNSFGYHYAHYNTMEFEGHVNGPSSDEEQSVLENEMDRLLPVVEEFTRKLSKEMDRLGYKICEGFYNEEAAKDYAINCMDEEFTADGYIY